MEIYWSDRRRSRCRDRSRSALGESSKVIILQKCRRLYAADNGNLRIHQCSEVLSRCGKSRVDRNVQPPFIFSFASAMNGHAPPYGARLPSMFGNMLPFAKIPAPPNTVDLRLSTASMSDAQVAVGYHGTADRKKSWIAFSESQINKIISFHRPTFPDSRVHRYEHAGWNALVSEHLMSHAYVVGTVTMFSFGSIGVMGAHTVPAWTPSGNHLHIPVRR